MQEWLRHERYGPVYDVTKGSEYEACQVLTYTVVADNETEAASIFSQLPSIRADGSLVFNLTQGMSGSHSFTVQAMDNSGDDATKMSETRRFAIRVKPVNAPPGFDLPTNISVFEDSEPSVSYTHLTLPTNREV